MTIFRVKSVKIYTGQKNLHRYTRGARDKYQVWVVVLFFVYCWKCCKAEQKMHCALIGDMSYYMILRNSEEIVTNYFLNGKKDLKSCFCHFCFYSPAKGLIFQDKGILENQFLWWLQFEKQNKTMLRSQSTSFPSFA